MFLVLRDLKHWLVRLIPHGNLQTKVSLNDSGNKKIYCLFERTLNIIYKILLQIFHILLDSWNISTEISELSAILDYWGYAYLRHKCGHESFHLDSQWSIWMQNSFLVAISNFELNKNILNNFWLLLSNL
jgi:hypothetical protein